MGAADGGHATLEDVCALAGARVVGNVNRRIGKAGQTGGGKRGGKEEWFGQRRAGTKRPGRWVES